jgi:hypothetical protein
MKTLCAIILIGLLFAFAYMTDKPIYPSDTEKSEQVEIQKGVQGIQEVKDFILEADTSKSEISPAASNNLNTMQQELVLSQRNSSVEAKRTNRSKRSTTNRYLLGRRIYAQKK